MFDSYKNEKHKHIDQSPEKIEVDEHRASTDKSIELANEYFKKCLRHIVASFRDDESNDLRFGSCVFKDQHSFKKILKVNFELNGKEYDVDVPLSDHDLDPDQLPVEFGEIIFEKLSNAIAEQLIETHSSTIAQELLNTR